MRDLITCDNGISIGTLLATVMTRRSANPTEAFVFAALEEVVQEVVLVNETLVAFGDGIYGPFLGPNDAVAQMAQYIQELEERTDFLENDNRELHFEITNVNDDLDILEDEIANLDSYSGELEQRVYAAERELSLVTPILEALNRFDFLTGNNPTQTEVFATLDAIQEAFYRYLHEMGMCGCESETVAFDIESDFDGLADILNLVFVDTPFDGEIDVETGGVVAGGIEEFSPPSDIAYGESLLGAICDCDFCEAIRNTVEA